MGEEAEHPRAPRTHTEGKGGGQRPAGPGAGGTDTPVGLSQRPEREGLGT